MNRRIVIPGALLLVGVAVAFGFDWKFFMLTGHFTPKRIVDELKSPIVVTGFNDLGLQTSDGRTISLPGVANVIPPASVIKDVKEHGVEISSDGTIFALVRVHHWCGNDPVRFHLARVDLSSVLLLLGQREQSGVTEYGIDPGLWRMAEIPHQELKEILH